MGTKSDKLGEKNKEEVRETIENINSITENDLFMKKTRLYIEFQFETNKFQAMLSKKVIVATVVSIPIIISVFIHRQLEVLSKDSQIGRVPVLQLL